MTNITYHIGWRCSISIEGHACAERTAAGSDLCCAAESMLACTLVETVKKLPLPHRYIYVADGYVYVSFGIIGISGIAAMAALMTIVNGYGLLAERYPDNVSLKKKRRLVKSE